MDWVQNIIGLKPPAMPRRALLPVAATVSPAESSGAWAQHLRRPLGSSDLRYGWLRALNGATKPILFTSLLALAHHVSAERGCDTIEMEDGDYDPPGAGPEGKVRIVTVYAIAFGTRTRLLGHAWLDGGGPETLRHALERIDPPRRARITPVRFRSH